MPAGFVDGLGTQGDDTAIVHYALGKLRPGDILVMDRAGDTRHACCGGGVAFAARAVRLLETVGFGARAGVCALRGLVHPDESLRNRRRTHWDRVKLSLEPTHV